jgi:hypothetical protein
MAATLPMALRSIHTKQADTTVKAVCKQKPNIGFDNKSDVFLFT